MTLMILKSLTIRTILVATLVNLDCEVILATLKLEFCSIISDNITMSSIIEREETKSKKKIKENR